MSSKAKVSGSVVAWFPSPAEQYQEPPLAPRLRPGAGRAVVAHEAAEAFAPPERPLARADDGEMILSDWHTHFLTQS